MPCIDADAVVLDADDPLPAAAPCCDRDAGRFWTVELDSIADKVLQDPGHLCTVHMHHRKGSYVDVGAGIFYRHLQVAHHGRSDLVHVDQCPIGLFRLNARVCQQIVDELSHPLRAPHGGFHVFRCIGAELIAVPFDQKSEVRHDHP